MGKTSKTTASLPTSTSSSFSINGLPVVSTSIKDGNISSSIYETEKQKAINDYIQDSLLSSISSINTFSPETIKSMDKEIESYTQQGVNSINEIYEPLIKNLENDVASRFGNLDNSIFLDNLNSLESKRSDAVSSLAQNIQSKKSDLVNNELSNRYDYLNFLTDYQDEYLDNLLSIVGVNNSNLSLNNSYQKALYSSLSENDSYSNAALLSKYLNAMSGIL